MVGAGNAGFSSAYTIYTRIKPQTNCGFIPIIINYDVLFHDNLELRSKLFTFGSENAFSLRSLTHNFAYAAVGIDDDVQATGQLLCADAINAVDAYNLGTLVALHLADTHRLF